ncbi:MAG: hypothetical protein Q3X12_06145, partial [Hallella sp.]|nr:hypothetical protein [Hallella sp.]
MIINAFIRIGYMRQAVAMSCCLGRLIGLMTKWRIENTIAIENSGKDNSFLRNTIAICGKSLQEVIYLSHKPR